MKRLFLISVLGIFLCPASAAACDLVRRVGAAQRLLESAPVTMGTKNYRYVEYRAGKKVTFNEPEVQIALALLDPDICEVSSITITKRGDQLIAPEGYGIEVVKRANGIQWNYWATQYTVKKPEGFMVLANKFPIETASIVYTAYTDELNVPELVQSGRDYLDALASRAHDDLRLLAVPSLSVNGSLISEVPELQPQFIARLALIEHMDLGEFLLDPEWTSERILIVIGANRDRTAAYTCSKASACGLMQFTSGTYALMVKTYPTAQLIPDFIEGARNPFNAMKAAFLLHDYNLSRFKRKLTVNQYTALIANTALVEESLSSAYNTGEGRTVLVLKAYFTNTKKFPDWVQAKGSLLKAKLVAETKGYISKLRYLRD